MNSQNKKQYLTITSGALLLVVMTFINSACQQSDCVACDTVPCHPDAKTAKRVVDQRGLVAFDIVLNRWVVIVSIEGTYDSQDVGIVCDNLPEAYQQEGEWVIFSGTYKRYSGEDRPPFPGQVYYYLFVSSIAILEDE